MIYFSFDQSQLRIQFGAKNRPVLILSPICIRTEKIFSIKILIFSKENYFFIFALHHFFIFRQPAAYSYFFFLHRRHAFQRSEPASAGQFVQIEHR